MLLLFQREIDSANLFDWQGGVTESERKAALEKELELWINADESCLPMMCHADQASDAGSEYSNPPEKVILIA